MNLFKIFLRYLTLFSKLSTILPSYQLCNEEGRISYAKAFSPIDLFGGEKLIFNVSISNPLKGLLIKFFFFRQALGFF